MPTPRRWKDEAERKRAYRARKKAEESQKAGDATAPTPVATQPADLGPAPASPVLAAILTANPNASVLEAIRDNPQALDSDRIRATSELQKLIALEREGTGPSREWSELVALRRTIEALPVGDRLKWLKGELEEHRAAGAYENKEDA